GLKRPTAQGDVSTWIITAFGLMSFPLRVVQSSRAHPKTTMTSAPRANSAVVGVEILPKIPTLNCCSSNKPCAPAEVANRAPVVSASDTMADFAWRAPRPAMINGQRACDNDFAARTTWEVCGTAPVRGASNAGSALPVISVFKFAG